MLTFQDNKVHTLKILAPYLDFNVARFPYIGQFFREICLKDDIQEKKDLQKKKSKKQKELKEQREIEKELKEKDKELKERNGRKELLEQINNKNGADDTDNNEQKRPTSMSPNKKREESSKIRKYEELSIKKRSKLNQNTYLENITIHLKINDLPEIFNICLMNNIAGLKSINLGIFDEITFIGFMNSYKKNRNLLTNLTSLKISLGVSVVSYISLEKYILEYININSPALEEKFLFSDLQIILESKMRDLIQLVYVEAVVPKLIIFIYSIN